VHAHGGYKRGTTRPINQGAQGNGAEEKLQTSEAGKDQSGVRDRKRKRGLTEENKTKMAPHQKGAREKRRGG